MDAPYVSSAVIVYRETCDRREYLLLHYRDAPPRGPWTWLSPTGKRKPGESGLQCARRELFEETGIEFDCVPVAPQEDGWLFYCKVPTDAEVRLSEEHDDYRWLTADQAVDLLEPEVVKAGIPKVESLLDGRDR